MNTASWAYDIVFVVKSIQELLKKAHYRAVFIQRNSVPVAMYL